MNGTPAVDRAVFPTISDERLLALARVGIPGYDPWRDAGECVFSIPHARKVVEFFSELLRHVEGELAGRPFLLQEWQAAIIVNAFGWIRPDGTRRYRKVFVFVPRKNGKTMLGAGIALFCGMADGEPGPQVYSAASEKEQAALVFRDAAGMIRQEPELDARCRIYRTFKSIEFVETSGIYRALSSDAESKHGANTHCAVIDELHAHRDRTLYDVMVTSTSARRQPLLFIITTADYARVSICNELHDYARKVRDGVIRDEHFLPVVYEADARDDWRLEATWRKANPNLGVSKSLSYMAEAAKEAGEKPASLNSFLRLDLNIVTNADVAWFDAIRWAENIGPLGWKELETLLAGRACFAALDLASTTDLAAWVLAFPLGEDDGMPRGGFAVLPRFFIPKDGAELRERRDNVPYTAWERDGAIVMTPGEVIDYDVIWQQMMADFAAFNVRTLLFDRWNASSLIKRAQDESVECVAFGQGFASMNAPAKMLEALVAGRTLRHGGHPVLAWNASNVMVERDAAGNIKPSKARSKQRIDGIVALVMALGGAILNPDDGASDFGGVWRM